LITTETSVVVGDKDRFVTDLGFVNDMNFSTALIMIDLALGVKLSHHQLPRRRGVNEENTEIKLKL
jgi:hypothetical protein